ncbi:type II toxin-antitoxin system HicB family antitoxin [Calidifontimicrobium sp. SYSU G02091]|uniref:type II toxin-antitoxin system HicB family antitoxin n=1 Tax=Calidifontimicrobium sp. SYSU G02091 TaxID=2926421 RepID=UPI001F534858|nr:type II toxin-antitoxin system HicB family antitoxin [Calidifontimicrobium sp. SYSU G02091]MCI1193535.1 type II toxin-antitoxin system HicB family antitoxin [Calidifontimicrobium sp. SYSU G02091]
MKFPIALEPGTATTAWGVVVPDLPGCFSAGDTAEQAFANAVEAIEAHLELLAEDGLDIQLPRPLDHWQADPQFAGWVWGLVEVDTSRFEGKAEKINITLPRRLLARVDEYARAHGMTRSGFLAQAAQRAMQAS